MWLTLSACLLITDAQHVERIADFNTGEAPVLNGLSPTYGTNAGGGTVTVTGSALEDVTEVWFGSDQAEILAAADGELQVRVPASAATTWVDLRVVNEAGEDTLPAAFQYWQDATGQVGATGELVWFFTVGGYWDETQSADYGRSTVRFTEPFDFQFFWNWSQSLNTCVRITQGDATSTFVPGYTSIDAISGTVTQNSPSSSISLEWNPVEVRFTAYDLAETQVTPGETYDLALSGSTAIPDFAMPGVFRVPDHFDVTEPDIFSQTLPDITDDQHFAWTTEDPADVVLLQVGMLNAAGSGFEEELFCAASDVGSFTLQSEWWTRWASGRFVNVLIGRYNTGEGLLPFNNGKIAVASSLWYYGAAGSR
jgi:IPT/TIG domain